MVVDGGHVGSSEEPYGRGVRGASRWAGWKQPPRTERPKPKPLHTTLLHIYCIKMKTTFQNNPWLYGSIWAVEIYLPFAAAAWRVTLSATYFCSFVTRLNKLILALGMLRSDEWMNLKVRWMTTRCNHPRAKSRCQQRSLSQPNANFAIIPEALLYRFVNGRTVLHLPLCW